MVECVQGSGAALRAGMTLRSAVDDSLALLVLAVGSATRLPTHDGVPMTPGRPPSCAEAVDFPRTSVRAGEIYVDSQSGLTVRCTGSGHGIVAYAGAPLRLARDGVRATEMQPAGACPER